MVLRRSPCLRASVVDVRRSRLPLVLQVARDAGGVLGADQDAPAGLVLHAAREHRDESGYHELLVRHLLFDAGLPQGVGDRRRVELVRRPGRQHRRPLREPPRDAALAEAERDAVGELVPRRRGPGELPGLAGRRAVQRDHPAEARAQRAESRHAHGARREVGREQAKGDSPVASVAPDGSVVQPGQRQQTQQQRPQLQPGQPGFGQPALMQPGQPSQQPRPPQQQQRPAQNPQPQQPSLRDFFGGGFGVYTFGGLSLMAVMASDAEAGAYLGLWSISILVSKGLGTFLGGALRDIMLLGFNLSPGMAYGIIYFSLDIIVFNIFIISDTCKETSKYCCSEIYDSRLAISN